MHTVKYMKVGNPAQLTATFQNIEDAQLWWDTIWYLRKEYEVESARPRAA